MHTVPKPALMHVSTALDFIGMKSGLLLDMQCDKGCWHVAKAMGLPGKFDLGSARALYEIGQGSGYENVLCVAQERTMITLTRVT